MKVLVQRVYDYTLTTKGTVILADRLWPRGVTKVSLGKVLWMKELAPSSELRRWFHENKRTRYKAFVTKYSCELAHNREIIRESFKQRKEPLIILTAAKEIELSHIPTLVNFLKEF